MPLLVPIIVAIYKLLYMPIILATYTVYIASMTNMVIYTESIICINRGNCMPSIIHMERHTQKDSIIIEA
jgi:hypothetical protein